MPRHKTAAPAADADGQEAGASGGAFVCSQCSQPFKNEKTLKNHIDFKHGDELRFGCDICGNRYRYSASLSKHRKLTHKLEPITYVWVHDSELSARERQEILVRNFKRKQQRIENKDKKVKVSPSDPAAPAISASSSNAAASSGSASATNGATVVPSSAR